MMITGRRVVQTVSAAILLAALGACDAGTPSRSADEIADDSALAADLALANRDTLLVDSIGALPPTVPHVDSLNTAPSDTTQLKPNATESSAPPTTPAIKVAPTPAPAPVPVAAPAPAPAPAPVIKATARRLTGIKACNSPTQENQNECIRASIASADARMNRVYRALITEMRRTEGVKGAAKDPPSVQRLRISQRSWLASRDSECRKRGRGKEGALWAKPRARCLAQFSVQRANELADNFSRLTAH